ncbi:MAG TPA: MFS transporter [Alphaproteobacteria bacterium]
MQLVARWIAPRFHYGWVVVGLTFLTLLAAAGVRATPSVLIIPLEQTFGWDRATISMALSASLFLFGFMGPFAGASMQSLGVRPTVLTALTLIVIAVFASTFMTAPWQFVVTWGLLVGIGTGCMAQVLSATVANRWFVQRRGVVIGLLSASTATGQLVFLPMLASVAESIGWRAVIYIVGAAAALVIPLIYWFMPERPYDLRLPLYGGVAAEAPPTRISHNPIVVAFQALGRGAKHRDFWLLFGGFYVCGLSTNGLIGTHLIAACFDQGIPEVNAAGLLAMMGVFDLIGTTLSGWLSDRWSNRWLLFWYYGLRGLSLIYLPFTGYTFYGLSLFAVFYGLDWLATVPPTVRLTNDIFGKQDAPILFGWIFTGHQIGAATAAFGAGFLRTSLNTYLEAFVIAGLACGGAALMSLAIGRRPKAGVPAGAAAGAAAR